MRIGKVNRETGETRVYIEINLDGTGIYNISTPIPLLNHMLESFSKHSHFDLIVRAEGDVEVDHHHLIEDVGIVLGAAFSKALPSKRGIERFGHEIVPMDESLVLSAVDISGRTYFVYSGFPEGRTLNGVEFDLFREFWKSFCENAKINLHLNLLYGLNLHHMAEASFKATARALKKAVKLTGLFIPSTKGKL